jgi:hypothetical protein
MFSPILYSCSYGVKVAYMFTILRCTKCSSVSASVFLNFTALNGCRKEMWNVQNSGRVSDMLIVGKKENLKTCFDWRALFDTGAQKWNVCYLALYLACQKLTSYSNKVVKAVSLKNYIHIKSYACRFWSKNLYCGCFCVYCNMKLCLL